MTTHAQIESRKEYFLQFNYVYTPDRYIGLWWQFRTRLMSDKDAKAFITPFKTPFRLSPPVFQDAQMHLTHNISTYHTMTKDYRGHAQSPHSRNSPSADDKNLEGCLPGPSTSPQIRETPRQEGAGRSSVSQEPRIIPDPESSTDTQY